MGLMWIPLVIGIQFVLLYVFWGGPQALLVRVVGPALQIGSGLGWMQVGLPMALVMAFPSLITLAFIDKWLHPVGWLEIGAIQGLSFIMMLRWFGGHGHGDSEECSVSQPVSRSGGVVQSSSESMCLSHQRVTGSVASVPCTQEGTANSQAMGVPEGVCDTSLEHANTIRIPAAMPCQRRRDVAGRKEVSLESVLFKRLKKIYLWNDIGHARVFSEARKTPLVHLVGRDDVAMLGPELFARLRAVVREVMMNFPQGSGSYRAEDGHETDLPEREEYLEDVMRRLTYSVLFSYDRLFIDRMDIELCGQAMLLSMYRLVLFEVGSEMPSLPTCANLH